MSTRIEQPQAAKASPAWTLLWAAILIAGLAGWIVSIGADTPRAWRALLINFAFFACLSAGMMVWSAIVTVAQGRWMKDLERTALAGIAFAPVTIVALAALWWSAPQWAPWIGRTDLPQAAWLSKDFLFGRDMAALVGMWGMAIVYWRLRRRGKGLMWAGPLVVAYCGTYTLLAFDLIMALEPRWYSTMFGGYFFISGAYIGLAGWTFLAALQRRPAGQLHDLGKLLVAFSLLTTYTMFSQLLPIWYENLPQEVPYVIQRRNMVQWANVSLALLCTVYLGPLVLLLTRWAKRTPPVLAGVSLLMLVGMWVERWWEVTPIFSSVIVIGLPELACAAASLAAFKLCYDAYLRRVPPPATWEAPVA